MGKQRLEQWLQRWAIALIAIVAVFGCTWGNAAQAAGQEMTVYRDPSCGCCEGWISHLEAEGFQVKNIATPEVNSMKQQYGIPEEMTSCHTGIIDGYTIEGHVPSADIHRLIAEHPNVNGIAVPGMPVGTPGMEDGDRQDSFTVYSFGEEGVQTWNHYSF